MTWSLISDWQKNMTWSLLSDWQTKYHMIFNIWLTDRIWQYDMIFNIWLTDKIWHDLYYLTDRQNMTWSLISDWHKIWHDLYYLTDRQHIFSVISWQEDVTFSDYWLNPRPTVFKAHSLSVIFCIIYIWSK